MRNVFAAVIFMLITNYKFGPNCQINDGRSCLLRRRVLSWLRQLVTPLGFFGGKQGFVPKSILVEFVVVKVAMGHFSPSTSVFTPVIIIPTMLHIH